MPGVNVIVNLDKNKIIPDIDVSKTIEKIKFDSSYISQVLFKDNDIKIIFSGYKEYPFQKFEFDDKTIIIDGAIYGKTYDEVNNRLGQLLPVFINNATGDCKTLTEFILSTDGEYTIYYIDKKSSTLIILNDGLGRLPYYQAADLKSFVLGRSMRFVTEFLSSVVLDDYSLMEYFQFSTTLGERTFFKNIERVLPNSMYIINYKTKIHSKRIIYQYNLDERHAETDLNYYIKNMHDLFLEGVRKRVDYFKDRKTILPMSGGLDSRAVMMALLKCDAQIQGITYSDFYNMHRREIPVVKALVEKFKVNHRFYDMPENNIPMMEKLISAKDGMGVMGLMGSILYSMEMVDKTFGKNIVYYTGDEGNYIAAPRSNGKEIDSTAKLVQTIIAHNSLSTFSIEDTARMFGKSTKDFVDYLLAYFESYPEKSNIHKYDRFFIFERSFKFTMEGQDRLRLYFWPLAPHYSIDYARFAFKIPNEYLTAWKVYIGMLRALNPESVKIKYANFGIPLDSPLLPIYLPMRALATSNETFRRNLIGFLRLLRHPTSVGKKIAEQKSVAELKSYYQNLIVTDKNIQSYIDVSYLSKLMADEKYIYKMYLVTNLLKYLGSIENKNVPYKI